MSIRIFTITFTRSMMRIRTFTITFTRLIMNTWMFDVTFTRVMMITWYPLSHLLESQTESDAQISIPRTRKAFPLILEMTAFCSSYLCPITIFLSNKFGSMSAILQRLSFWQVSLSRGHHYQFRVDRIFIRLKWNVGRVCRGSVMVWREEKWRS